jgi:MFS family permease
MIYLDATIVNVALPDIQKDFGGGEQALQWVVAAYSLTMGMFIMSAASLADRRAGGGRSSSAPSCSRPPPRSAGWLRAWAS